METPVKPSREEKLRKQLGGFYDYMYDEMVVVSKALDKVNEEVGRGNIVYPASHNLFRAFSFFPPEDTKVVFVAQDPYASGIAEGLCFSVDHEFFIPPSLRIIFKELTQSVKKSPEEEMQRWMNTKLDGWAEQGVLLLNTILTVTKSKPLSHKDFGWQDFTFRVIQKLSESENPPVYVLWGREAQECEQFIDPKAHVLSAPHPAAEVYSGNKAGFYGCNHFNEINKILTERGQEPIDWYK